MCYTMERGGMMMANMKRKFSLNILTLMQNAGLSCEDLAKKLNYSYRDMYRIFEGRFMLSPTEIRKIAEFFRKTKSELLHYESDKVVLELQYIKEFSDTDNLDKILDLLDEYVELKEAM